MHQEGNREKRDDCQEPAETLMDSVRLSIDVNTLASGFE